VKCSSLLEGTFRIPSFAELSLMASIKQTLFGLSSESSLQSLRVALVFEDASEIDESDLVDGSGF
jgi:hypothetical protein